MRLSGARRWLYALAGGFFIGLAILTKGPVGWLVPALTLGVYVLLGRLHLLRWWPAFLLWTVPALATCALWLGPEWARNGSWFTEEFLRYQWRLMQTEDAGHGGFPGYHLVVLLWGCFPASLFAIFALFKNRTTDSRHSDFRYWMILLLAVVIIVFSLVQSKIVHYSSLAYFPITFLAATALHDLFTQRRQATRWLRWSLLGIGGTIVLVLFAGLWVATHPPQIAAQLSDPLAREQMLDAPVWTAWDAWPAVLLLLVLVIAGVLMRGRRWKSAAIVLFAGTALFVQAALYTYIVRAEEYSQGPAMRWYQELSGQPVYVYSRFRSYAPFFYFRPPPPPAEYLATAMERAKADQRADAQHSFLRRPDSNPNWLLYSPDVDREVYVIARVQQVDDLLAIEGIELLEKEGGFALLRRRKPGE